MEEETFGSCLTLQLDPSRRNNPVEEEEEQSLSKVEEEAGLLVSWYGESPAIRKAMAC